jgi:hypothetical protein
MLSFPHISNPKSGEMNDRRRKSGGGLHKSVLVNTLSLLRWHEDCPYRANSVIALR